MERSIRTFRQLALYQPVMNGVGGNLAAVAASRLSTYYHRHAISGYGNGTLGTLPFQWTIHRFTSIKRAFFSSDDDSRAARVFIFLCLPGHIFFNWLISLFHSSGAVHGALFTSLYLTAAFAQVSILLFICQWLVAWMWKSGQNPDNAAIPYLTAIGDLLGALFLALAFVTLTDLEPYYSTIRAQANGAADRISVSTTSPTNYTAITAFTP